MSVVEGNFFDDNGMLKTGKEKDDDDELVEVDVEGDIKERAWKLMDKEVRRLIDEHNLTVERDDLILVTTYWKRRNGQVRYYQNAERRHYDGRVSTDRDMRKHTILVNRRIIEEDNKDGFIDVVRHELAHIEAYLVYDSSGHDLGWKRMAKKLGAEPKSRDNKFEVEDYKYRIVCGNGCFDRKYQRKSKVVKNPEIYNCKKCGDSLYRVDEKEDE